MLSDPSTIAVETWYAIDVWKLLEGPMFSNGKHLCFKTILYYETINQVWCYKIKITCLANANVQNANKTHILTEPK